MDDKLTAKTAKFTSLENLYVYSSCVLNYNSIMWLLFIFSNYVHTCVGVLA